MEDLRLKRQLIEEGQLKTWSRRGRRSHRREIQMLKHVVDLGLRLTGLHVRGKRNALRPVVQRQRFEFDHLPEAFDGFTILHLSDLHADGLVGLADRLAEQLHHVEVDLCVLTGDYRFGIDGSCEQVYPAMQRILSSVKARHGTLGILGNHDVAEMVPEFERLGVRMLVNQTCDIEQEGHRIWIAGLDDPHYYGCDDLPGTLRHLPDDAFKILLVHTPEMIDEAAASGIHLYLCGHTHGGQICLPFMGPVLTHAHCSRRFVRGPWWHKGVSGYTSRGIGCSGVRARFLCPPEIVVAELRRTRSQAMPQAVAEASQSDPRYA